VDDADIFQVRQRRRQQLGSDCLGYHSNNHQGIVELQQHEDEFQSHQTGVGKEVAVGAAGNKVSEHCCDVTQKQQESEKLLEQQSKCYSEIYHLFLD
jgi:hypothetical protein